MKGKHIETGVDRLVELVRDEGKIELSKAAKELGVSKTVVQEWSEFLEKHDMISVEYSLSKTYLVEKKLSEKDVQKKKKEYDAKKDAFVRKVETVLQTLDKESLGFEQVKEKFEELEGDIGEDIENIRKEVNELQHYEDLKENLEEEVKQKKKEYEDMFEEVHKKIKGEETKYDNIIENIRKEKSKIDEEKLDVEYMENKEDNIKKRVKELRKLLDGIDEQIDEKEEELDKEKERLEELEKQADEFIENLKEKKEKDLDPLVGKAKQNQEDIEKVQEDMLKKLEKEKSQIEEYEYEGKKVIKELKKFFDDKSNTEKLLKDVEEEKEELEKEMQELIDSAKVFKVASGADVEEQIGKLRERFEKLEEKREKFKKDLKKATKKVLGVVKSE